MDLQQFKNELQLVSVDPWDDAMDALTECAAHLYTRRGHVPGRWGFSPSGHGYRLESYWYTQFKTTCSTELEQIGNYLFNTIRSMEGSLNYAS